MPILTGGHRDRRRIGHSAPAGPGIGREEIEMSYQFFRTESAAIQAITTAQSSGRQAYILRLRTGCYEVRSW